LRLDPTGRDRLGPKLGCRIGIPHVKSNRHARTGDAAELRVAEFFDRSGDAEAAKRHRAVAERHGRAAEDRYMRLLAGSEEHLV